MAKTRKKKLNPLMVEREETIGEVQTKTMEMVRMKRVKYEGNEYTFIDLRTYSRGWDDDSNEIYHPTKRGVQIKESDFQKVIASYLDASPRKSRRKVH